MFNAPLPAGFDIGIRDDGFSERRYGDRATSDAADQIRIGHQPESRAQQRFKIGLLDTGLGAAFTVPFMRKLVDLGYVEDKNVVIERKSAEGNAERLKEFADSTC